MLPTGTKPNIVKDYNEGMSGIAISDQMLWILRKTICWYKKLFSTSSTFFVHALNALSN